jgi:hypothetical protein
LLLVSIDVELVLVGLARSLAKNPMQEKNPQIQFVMIMQ